MAPLATILAFFVYIPLDSMVEGLVQPSHTAQLGDPCTEPGDCKVPNSECVQTDNLYWNRQNFCVCQAGYHPSTGFCVADSGSETGMVKLDYNHHQHQSTTPTTTTSSSNNVDTTRNASARSLLMTPAPPGNILQGFHFGNRTQSIVSNLVEQLTHLRGQEKTDLMKERLETMGLPLLQPVQSLAREEVDETTTVANVAVTSADTNGYYLEAAAAAAVAFVPATPPSTTSPSTQVISTPSTTSTTTASLVANFNPFAMKPPPSPPQRVFPTPLVGTSMATTASTSTTALPAPTMATVVTHKASSSNSDNNSPFLPPALPPFFTKPSPLKTTTSTSTTSTTTIAMFNGTTASPATAAPPNPADDPEARLALLKKVQNLIVKTSPLTQRPAPTPDPTTPLNLLIPVTVHASGAGSVPPKMIFTSPLTSSPLPTTAATEPAAPQAAPPFPPVPPALHPSGQKPHHNNIHYPQVNGGGMKNILNNLGLGKPPPIPVDMPLKPDISQPVPAPGPGPAPKPTLPSAQQPTSESESQQQVRSTVVDHLPNVDFYAVFRSAAENVIREYLGGIVTTTSAPSPFGHQTHGILDLLHGAHGPGGGAHAGPGMIDGHIEKLLEKMVDSKTGPGAVLLQVNNHPHHHHPHQGHGPHQGAPTAPSLPDPRPPTPPHSATPGPVPNMSKSSASGATTMSTPLVTRRHPFAWSSTSRGHPAHPLPRIVFTGR